MKKLLVFDFLLLLTALLSLVRALSDSCSVIHLPNSTSYLLEEGVGSCDNYNWLIKGTVVANEDGFNRTLVQSRGRSNITFFSCYDSVTYKNVCTRITVNCSSTCARFPPPTENFGAVIGGSIGCFICLFIIGCGLLI